MNVFESSNRPGFTIAANWKMNLVAADVASYFERFSDLDRDLVRRATGEVLFFPPHVLLAETARQASALQGFAIGTGAQDVHPETHGAFTGDVAAAQIASVGATWCLCGHSERRVGHGEDDRLVRAKMQRCFQAGLSPILCLGESLEERRSGATMQVLAGQLEGSLPSDIPDDARLVVAYEPVWAIGTGETATPELAQEAHAFLREQTERLLPDHPLTLLYGGSAKPANCEELLAQPDVDGFLVGGASLDPDSFLDMIHRCARLTCEPEAQP